MLNYVAIIGFLVPLIVTLLVTPFVIKLAYKIGAIDKTNHRKVHKKIMPRMGGLAIFIGVIAGYFATGLYNEKITAISIGGILIIMLGILDDIYELSAKIKFFAQVIIASIVVSTGLTIDFISIPLVVEKLQLGWLSYPITILWIVAITNAINLIDGLDGLAAGISSIGIATVAIMAMFAGKELILALALIVLGSTIGFLFYNFHPAKIFMGDTGALFLGYSISILSLLGLFKSVTLFSFVIPIIILGVPIFDTAFAILRRFINKQPISAPDKAHLHHKMMALGLSHKNTVLVLYAVSILFSILAVILSSATIWVSITIIFCLLILIHLIAEVVGVVDIRYSPLLKIYKKVVGKQ